MVRNVGIVVDSTVGTHFKSKLFKDASVIPLTMLVEGRSYPDDQLKGDNLLRLLKHKKDMQIEKPAPELFVKAYHKQLDLGYRHIICLTSDKNLSDTYISAKLAQEIMHSDHIVVIDSKTVGHGMAYLLEVLYRSIGEHKPFDEVLAILKQAIDEIEMIFIQSTYQSKRDLFKSDHAFKDVYKTLFGVKTVYQYHQGHFKVLKKMVGKHKVIDYVSNLIAAKNNERKLAFMNMTYVDDAAEAKMLEHEIYQKSADISITYYGFMHPLLAVYLGRAGIGILLV